MGNNLSITANTGGIPFDFDCGQGNVITRVDVNSSDHINSIQFTCADGKKSGRYGGDGGTPSSYENADGLTGIGGTISNYVKSLQFGSNGFPVETLGTPNGNLVPYHTCMDAIDTKFHRVAGNSGEYLNSLQFWCGQYTQKQAIQAANIAAANAEAAANVAKAAADAAAATAKAEIDAAIKAAVSAAMAEAARVAAAAKAESDANEAARVEAVRAEAVAKIAAEEAAAANVAAEKAKALSAASSESSKTAIAAASSAAESATTASMAPNAALAAVAAQAAEQSAANASSAAASSVNPAIIVSPNGEITSVNASGGTLTGTHLAGSNYWILIMLFVIIVAVIIAAKGKFFSANIVGTPI